MCFSFIFTEKTALMLKDNDILMKTIKEKSDEFKLESINASIQDDTIIPGVKGKKINNNKSYSNMKRLGEFNENLLIYDLILPEVTLSNTYDKYIIGGNSRKNMVSLVFIVTEKTNIDSLISLLSSDDKVNIFIDGMWLEDNESELKKLTNLNYNIGNLSYNGDYTDSGYVWINTVINKHSKQVNNYCYAEQKNEEYLRVCKLQKSYTIFPSIIVKDNPLIEIKSNLKSGSIISFNINSKTLKELPLIIDYIHSKGYEIVTLDDLISEDM